MVDVSVLTVVEGSTDDPAAKDVSMHTLQSTLALTGFTSFEEELEHRKKVLLNTLNEGKPVANIVEKWLLTFEQILSWNQLKRPTIR